MGAILLLGVGLVSCTPSSSLKLTSFWNMGTRGKQKALSHQDSLLYNSLYAAAVNQRMAEHYDEAYVLLEQALAINAYAPEALYEMAMISLHNERPVNIADGDSLLKYAALLAPENREYQRAYALNLAEREEYAEAVKVYEKLIAKKENEEMLSELLNLYRALGQNEKALKVLNRLEQLEGTDNSIYFERYKIYIAQQDTARAYAAIDDLCAANAGDLYFEALKANLYHEQGYNDKALALFQKVLKQEPKMNFARVSLLNFYRTLREEKRYQQLFDEMVDDPDLESNIRDNIMRQFYIDALQAKKDTAEVMPVIRRVMALPLENRNLGEMTLAYLSEKNTPRKEKLFVHRRIVEAEPDCVPSRLELILNAVETSNTDEIHQLSKEGRLYTPGMIGFYIYDALAMNDEGRVDEAVKILEAGEEKADSSTDTGILSQMVSLLGDLYHESGKVEQSYSAYERAIALDASNWSCMNNYAYFLSKEKRDLDKAEALSKQVIEAEPDNATFLDTYAWILFMQENYALAKVYIDETLKFAEPTPDNVTLFDHAGDIYYHNGEKELALGFWKKALKLAEEEDMRVALKKKIRRGKP